MGRQLLADEPAFAAAVAELEPTFVEKVGFSLRQVLDAGEPVVGIDRIQPVLVGMQLALTELWRSYGVEPDAVIGHSMGEVTAAVVAGALSPAEGLDVIATRSRLMSRLSGQGAMALLELDAAAAERLIAEHPGVTLAVYASPRQSVIAGPPEQVDALIATVDAPRPACAANRGGRGIPPSHHRSDPARIAQRPFLFGAHRTEDSADQHDRIHRRLADVRRRLLAGQCAQSGAVQPGRRRCRRRPQQFRRDQPAPAAHPRDHRDPRLATPSRAVHVGATVNRDNPETLTFHTQLAAIRPPVDGMAQLAGSTGKLADIPPTPWLHTQVLDGEPARRDGEFTGAHPLLGMHVELPVGRCARLAGRRRDSSCTRGWQDHKVHGQPVMPGAGFAEIALAAGCEAAGPAGPERRGRIGSRSSRCFRWTAAHR